ncbi:MAG: hypothetical protein JW841_10595 [Deltaproteobacteria bacterium]|nr:hypothetical protein [Deltaproteobacteria bacterium]
MSSTANKGNDCFILEELCIAIERVEALANAANESLSSLPFTADIQTQKQIRRLFRLVEATAEEATKALAQVESIVNK